MVVLEINTFATHYIDIYCYAEACIMLSHFIWPASITSVPITVNSCPLFCIQYTDDNQGVKSSPRLISRGTWQ